MKALILVDIQNVFLPGGALGVPRGDEVVRVANKLVPAFELAVAARDWHPPNHVSFASRHPGRSVGDVIEVDGLEQILWPDHAVQNTPGAEFAPGLDMAGVDKVLHKGTDPAIDSYSAFFDNGHRKSTGLGEYLKDKGVKEVFLVGLALDYCVRYSTLDARRLGFAANVVLDGTRGVEREEGDCDRALEAMRQAGVRLLRRDDIEKHTSR